MSVAQPREGRAAGDDATEGAGVGEAEAMDPLKSESVPGPDPIPGGGGPVRVPGGGWALASGGLSAYHPFECRPGCVHCDRRAVDGHDPEGNVLQVRARVGA